MEIDDIIKDIANQNSELTGDDMELIDEFLNA